MPHTGDEKRGFGGYPTPTDLLRRLWLPGTASCDILLRRIINSTERDG